MSEQPQQPVSIEPTHPDYARILEVLAEGIEAAISSGDYDLDSFLSQYVDPKSIGYVGMHRIIGMGVFAFDNPMEFAQQQDKILKMAMLYSEAFASGIIFEQTQDRSEDAVLAKIMRKILDPEERVYLFVRDGGDLVIDGTVAALEPEEQAVLADHNVEREGWDG